MNEHLLTFISWDKIKTSIKASTLELQPKHQRLIPCSKSPFLRCPTCGKHMVVTPKIPFRTNLALCPSFFTESPCGYQYGIHYSQLLKTIKKQLQAILSNETSTCLHLTATGVQITKEEQQQPFEYLCNQDETRLAEYTETMETALEHLFQEFQLLSHPTVSILHLEQYLQEVKVNLDHPVDVFFPLKQAPKNLDFTKCQKKIHNFHAVCSCLFSFTLCFLLSFSIFYNNAIFTPKADYGFLDSQKNTYFLVKEDKEFHLVGQSENINIWLYTAEQDAHIISTKETGELLTNGGFSYTDPLIHDILEEYQHLFEVLTREIPYSYVRVFHPFKLTSPLNGDLDMDGRINVFLCSDISVEADGYYPKAFSKNLLFHPSIDGIVIKTNPFEGNLYAPRSLDGHPDIFAHELQHLLFEVYFPFTTTQEVLWFNELLSIALEELAFLDTSTFDLYSSKDYNFSSSWLFYEDLDFFYFDQKKGSYLLQRHFAEYLNTLHWYLPDFQEHFVDAMYEYLFQAHRETKLPFADYILTWEHQQKSSYELIENLFDYALFQQANYINFENNSYGLYNHHQFSTYLEHSTTEFQGLHHLYQDFVAYSLKHTDFLARYHSGYLFDSIEQIRSHHPFQFTSIVDNSSDASLSFPLINATNQWPHLAPTFPKMYLLDFETELQDFIGIRIPTLGEDSGEHSFAYLVHLRAVGDFTFETSIEEIQLNSSNIIYLEQDSQETEDIFILILCSYQEELTGEIIFTTDEFG